MKHTAAIVTTLRTADPSFEPVLHSFITYHLSVGFAHLYLFFDDQHDPALAGARRHPDVTAIPNDATLHRLWRQTGVYRAQRLLREYTDREVRARQTLNVAVALDLARRQGIEWLFHIDLDELLYLGEQALPDHLQELSKKGVQRLTCLNHEAVPERMDIGDYFAQVTLFRRNPLRLPGRRLSPTQQAAVAQIPQLAPQFFHFYANGKSGVRVVDGVWPSDVHSFTLPQERTFGPRLRRRLAHSVRVRGALANLGPPGRRLRQMLQRPSGSVSALVSPQLHVLHYACCGFAHFWSKYRMRGAFADRWFGRSDIAAKIGTFHLEARDVVLAGDLERARRFYGERLVMEDAESIARLMDLGLLARFSQPAALLARTGEADGPVSFRAG